LPFTLAADCCRARRLLGGTVDPRDAAVYPRRNRPTWRTIVAKKFMYVSLGILALAVAYNLGATRTEAQGTGGFVHFERDTRTGSGRSIALTATGDVWRFDPDVGGLQPAFLGNLLGGPVSVEPDSWGSIKGNFR
jgi:hypothetical protein